MPIPSRCVLGLLTLTGWGCASVSTLQSAHTLGQGRGQLAVELHYQALTRPGEWSSYPMAGLAGRWGLTDRVDIGGKIGPSALELQLKWMMRPPPGWAVSLAPAMGVSLTEYQGAVLGSFNTTLPVLFGTSLGEDRQLVFGPRLHNTHLVGSAGSSRSEINLLYVGTTVGVAQRIKTGWVMPEVGFLYPLWVAASRTDGIGGLAWGGAKWTLQANLGVLWGGN